MRSGKPTANRTGAGVEYQEGDGGVMGMWGAVLQAAILAGAFFACKRANSRKRRAERQLRRLRSRLRETSEALGRISGCLEAGQAALEAGELRSLSSAVAGIETERRERYRLRLGRASLPKGGSGEPGDSTAYRRTESGGLVVLSDGMGSGPAARRESRAAAGLACDLISLGIGETEALCCVNRLLMSSGEYDMYATIDAFAFDGERCTGRFFKLGAPPSYILRKNGVTELRAETLPVGIVKGAAPARQELELMEGDRIIMTTDGVSDVLGEQMPGRIAALSGISEPERLAAALLQQAASGGEIRDDMTVIAALVVRSQ